MPGEAGQGDQVDLVLRPGPGEGEEIVEGAAQGQHRRPGIGRAGGRGDRAGLAARPLRHFDDGDGQAARGQPDRGGKPAHPGADHHRWVFARHRRASDLST